MTKPKKRYPPNNVIARRKPCIDCTAEGLENRRKAPYPGPRCTTHHRIKRATRKDTTWETQILLKYDLTAKEYWDIYNYQGGVCYICRRATGKRKRLSVDHCHKTGKIRGLLCTFDNRLLGWARDMVEFFERCIDYLTSPPAEAIVGERIAPIHDADLAA